MSESFRLAIVKPDWRTRGGFEIVIDRLAAHLSSKGHQVDLYQVDAFESDRRPFGVEVPDHVWDRTPQFFSYVARYENFRRLDVSRADLVISTQPPSFAVQHDRTLSLFYHHDRLFYELASYAERAGLVDSTVHGAASEAVRRLDNAALSEVDFLLAGSETVRERLVDADQLPAKSALFHAGAGVIFADSPLVSGKDGPVLCVSRHDFPKRTELFVHAAHLSQEGIFLSVGIGGRLGFAQMLSSRLSVGPAAEQIDDRELWLNAPAYETPVACPVTHGNLTFAGFVNDKDLGDLYREAFCFVAPALLEDYGLTVIEAMQFGRPIIVCRDGGHLAHLIEHEVNGLVVEPTGLAIAEAVARLKIDAELTEAIGRGARKTFEQFTWRRAFAEFDSALEAVMS